MTKNSVKLKWDGGDGALILNDETIENVSSPYTVENLTPDTTYTAKVVNEDGESNEVTFTTKEITYKEVTITLDMKGKSAGSVVENPHISKLTNGSSLLVPSNSAWTEISTTHYTLISALDDQTSNTSVSTNSYIHQRLFSFNIIEALERYDSNYFSDRNATTLAEKVAVVRNEMVTITANIWGFGSGPNSTYMAVRYWNGSEWKGTALVSGTTVKQAIESINNENIDEFGFVNVLAYTAASNGTTASSVSIDYTSLDITFLVEDTGNENLFDKNDPDILLNKGYSSTTNNIVSDTQYNISGFMNYQYGRKLLIGNDGTEVTNTNYFKIASFADGVWLSTAFYVAGGITLPSNATQFRVQYDNTVEKLQVQFDELTEYTEKISSR